MEEKTATLSIQQSSGGRGQKGSVSEFTNPENQVVKKGQVITLDEKNAISVVNITDNSIMFHSENLHVQGFSKGNILRPEPTDFEIHLQKFVEVYTPGMDYNVTWKITLLETKL